MFLKALKSSSLSPTLAKSHILVFFSKLMSIKQQSDNNFFYRYYPVRNSFFPSSVL